jgi:hypothetical protein
MGGLFNTRTLSFHTPYDQWDPIMRYYKALLGTQTRSIDTMPQVRVVPVDMEPNKFVVQWSLGGFGDIIPGTPLREYNAPNLEDLNQWLYSMENTRLETEKPYVRKLDGTGVNFPRELHEFALSALTAQGDLIYLGNITPENIEQSLPQMVLGLENSPYWGILRNEIPIAQYELDVVLPREFFAGNIQLADVDRLQAEARTLIESVTQENNNRPFWRVLREGSGGIITPTSVATIYNQNNPPPNQEGELYISPRTLAQALPTVYQMILSIPVDEEQRQQNINLLIRAVQEELGINLQRRFNTITLGDIVAPISSDYYGSSVETPFVVDGHSAKYLQVQNMSELVGSEYGMVKPVYNRYEPCLEAADFYEDAEENNLINFYTLMATVNFDTKDNQRVPNEWSGNAQRGNRAYQKYQNLSTLSGAVDILSLDIARNSLPQYFKSYMQALGGDGVSEGQRKQLGDLYKRAKLPEESNAFLAAYDFNEPLMPYYIEVNSTSGETGKVVETINEKRLSSYIVDKTQKADFLDEVTNYTVTTDAIFRADNPTVVSRTATVPLRQRIFNHVLQVSAFSGISDLVYTTFGKEAITGDVAGGMTSRNLDRLRQTANREARKEMLSYTDRVENRHFCGTEALLDVLNKRKEGAINPIAQTYIASTPTPAANQFTDTQVKYGQSYEYDLQRFQMAYGTRYAYKTLDITVPISLLQASDGSPDREVSPRLYIDYAQAGEAADIIASANPLADLTTRLPAEVVGYSFIVEVEPTEPRLLELPIYDKRYDSFGESLAGVSLKPVSVQDYPPTPPVLQILPIRDNYRQVLININLEAISRAKSSVIQGPQCTEAANYNNLYEYQKMFIDFTLEDNKILFQNDGLSEITNVKVVRTDRLIPSAFEADSIEQAYQSFCEENNPSAEIVTKSLEQDFGQVGAGSYGFMDDIEPNKIYYYTAFSTDLRGNISNPSEIMSVRLVYDKGFLVPEIGFLDIEELPNKTPVKKMTRFLEIKAADIQTQPFMETNEDEEIVSYKSLIEKAGQAGILTDAQEGSIYTDESGNSENAGFIIRLTSKDTGRKFDIRLNIKETFPVVNDDDSDLC